MRPFHQTFRDDFGREFSLTRFLNGDVAVTCHDTAHVFRGDAATRIAESMRDMPDACEEALRQTIEEELTDAGVLVYHDEAGEYMTPDAAADWDREAEYEAEHQRQESRADLFI